MLDPAGFYDRRFEEGYADYWPIEEYQRVAEVLSAAELPTTGTALDFGCGNGSFSKWLADRLPGWKVIGADLSHVAVENARRKYPELTFVAVDGLSHLGARFNLIFSHHVLEHVHDWPGTWRLFCSMAASNCRMLHVLPCGNPGSFEHRLCLLRRDGIDMEREGRFYSDDDPHLRRLRTSQMQEAASAVGFTLVQQYYAAHRWGQIWPLTHKSLAYLRDLTDWRASISSGAAMQMLAYRVMLMALAVGCLPTLFRWRLDTRNHDHWSDYPRHVLALCFTPVSLPLTRFLRFMSQREWRLRQNDPAGSEMFLVFASSAEPTSSRLGA